MAAKHNTIHIPIKIDIALALYLHLSVTVPICNSDTKPNGPGMRDSLIPYLACRVQIVQYSASA